MRNFLIFVSICWLTGCTPEPPPQPPVDMTIWEWQPTLNWINSCTYPDPCEGDVVYTTSGYILMVAKEDDGRIVFAGRWPFLEKSFTEGAETEVKIVLVGLQQSGYEGLIRKVVSQRTVEKAADYDDAVADWQAANDHLFE